MESQGPERSRQSSLTSHHHHTLYRPPHTDKTTPRSACTSHPLYSSDEEALHRTHPTLWNVIDFQRRTWTHYVNCLISPKAGVELRGATEPDAPDVWPPFDQEAYCDMITANMTTAMVVLDRGGHQALFGGRFDFGQEVKNVARAITGESWRESEYDAAGE